MNRITSKRLLKGLAVAVALTLFPMTMGCGGGDGTTVIEPGEDYQLTPQEQTNKELEMKDRGGN